MEGWVLSANLDKVRQNRFGLAALLTSKWKTMFHQCFEDFFLFSTHNSANYVISVHECIDTGTVATVRVMFTSLHSLVAIEKQLLLTIASYRKKVQNCQKL